MQMPDVPIRLRMQQFQVFLQQGGHRCAANYRREHLQVVSMRMRQATSTRLFLRHKIICKQYSF